MHCLCMLYFPVNTDNSDIISYAVCITNLYLHNTSAADSLFVPTNQEHRLELVWRARPSSSSLREGEGSIAKVTL